MLTTAQRRAYFEAGKAAGVRGEASQVCPHPNGSQEADHWLHGHSYGIITYRDTQQRQRRYRALQALSIGDTAFVWLSDASGGTEYPVIVTHNSLSDIRVKHLTDGTPRRFRSFLRQRGYTQLSGSGRGTQTLRLEPHSKHTDTPG